jgi:hypothetical protein
VTLVGPVFLEELDDPTGTFVLIRGQNANPTRVWRVSNPNQEASLQNVSLVRADGQPDDCGDPPSTFEPGAGNDGANFDSPNTFTGPDGSPVTVNIEPPTTNRNGDLVVNFQVDGVEFHVGGEPDENTGPLPPGQDLEVDDPSRAPSGTVRVVNAPEGFECVGLSIRTTQVPTQLGLIVGTEPVNPRYPRTIGNYSVRLLSGDGSTAWTENFIINSRFHTYFVGLEGLTIDRYRVTNVFGITDVSRVYRQIQGTA